MVGSTSKSVIRKQSGKLKRQPGGFPARKIPLFPGSLPNLPVKLAFHARSPPDYFLFDWPDCWNTLTVLEIYTMFCEFWQNKAGLCYDRGLIGERKSSWI